MKVVESPEKKHQQEDVSKEADRASLPPLAANLNTSFQNQLGQQSKLSQTINKAISSLGLFEIASVGTRLAKIKIPGCRWVPAARD